MVHTIMTSDSSYDHGLCDARGVTGVCDVISLGCDVNFHLAGPFQKPK